MIEFHGLHLIPEGNNLFSLGSAVDLTEFEFTMKLFRPGDRVLVAGAGMGSVFLATSIVCGPQNVLGVEANPFLLKEFAQRTRLNGERPHLLWGILDTKDGKGKFFIQKEHFLGSSVHTEENADMIEAPCLDINRIVERYSCTGLSLDVEGSEFELIPYVNLKPINRIMMEIHGSDVQAQNLIRILTDDGFKVELWHTQWPNFGLHVVGLTRN